MAIALRGRVGRGMGTGRLSGAVLVLLSCLATLYTGGRLWQDVQVQQKLLLAAKSSALLHKSSQKPLTVEDSILKENLKELQRQEALLQTQLAEAKAKGFVSELGADARPYAAAAPNAHTTTTSITAAGTAAGNVSQAAAPASLLVVVLISTSFGNRLRRDAIRSTWMPTGSALKKLEEEMGVVLRFIMGHSLSRGDSLDRRIEEENERFEDIIVMEDYEEEEKHGASKAKSIFAYGVRHWVADFYFKLNDDVYLSTMQLVSFLNSLRDERRLYLGCFKSGVVVTEPAQQWYEPEWVRFGDGKQYFQHAAKPAYGLTRDLALYVAYNRVYLHEYANEDISVGAWMLGLTATHHNDHRLCCASPPEGDCGRRREEGKACVVVSDWRCGGLCEAVKRMNEVHHQCA